MACGWQVQLVLLRGTPVFAPDWRQLVQRHSPPEVNAAGELAVMNDGVVLPSFSGTCMQCPPGWYCPNFDTTSSTKVQ